MLVSAKASGGVLDGSNLGKLFVPKESFFSSCIAFPTASRSAGTQTLSGNAITGNGYDGIYFNQIAGGVISFNDVGGNQNVGIHLSDYTSFGGSHYAPTVVTQNRGLHNAKFDAADDASAPDGDNSKTNNVWTKNLFGTTNPVGLSK